MRHADDGMKRLENARAGTGHPWFEPGRRTHQTVKPCIIHTVMCTPQPNKRAKLAAEAQQHSVHTDRAAVPNHTRLPNDHHHRPIPCEAAALGRNRSVLGMIQSVKKLPALSTILRFPIINQPPLTHRERPSRASRSSSKPSQVLARVIQASGWSPALAKPNQHLAARPAPQPTQPTVRWCCVRQSQPHFPVCRTGE